MSEPLTLPYVKGNVFVSTLKNWSVLESEGRWSLTHTSSAQFNVTKAGIYTLRYEGLLPFPSQTLGVRFDGQPLAAFANKPSTTTGLPFRQVIDLPLKSGSHTLIFQTNHSNSDGSMPGTQGDRRDLGVKLTAWSLAPVVSRPTLNYKLDSVSLSNSPSGTFPGMSGSQYLPVGRTGLNLRLPPSKQGQSTVLTFQIQPSNAPQTFSLTLNGVVKTWTSYRGEAVWADLDITQQARNGLLLSIKSQNQINSISAFKYLVDQNTLESKEVNFYMQELQVVSPVNFWQNKHLFSYSILNLLIVIFLLSVIFSNLRLKILRKNT